MIFNFYDSHKNYTRVMGNIGRHSSTIWWYIIWVQQLLSLILIYVVVSILECIHVFSFVLDDSDPGKNNYYPESTIKRSLLSMIDNN